MREILFKGKRIDNGEWVEGYYTESKGKTFWTVPTITPTIISIIP